MDGAYAGKDQGPINMAEQYRFEDFTPEELGRLRQLYDTLGLDPLPINRGEESFNTLLKPEERRQLFEAVRGEGATPEALGDTSSFRAQLRALEEGVSDTESTNEFIQRASAPPPTEAPAAAPVEVPAPSPAPASDVTVTRIGDTFFTDRDVEGAGTELGAEESRTASDLPPSLEPITTTGMDSLMGIIFDPLRENVPPLPPSLAPISPTVGEKATQIGIGAAEGALRYATPAAAAAAAFTATAPYAAMVPIPQAYAIPIIAAAGAYGGTYLLADTLADFFPAPPREELVPYREGALTFGGILGSAPSTLLIRAPSAAYTSNNVGSRIYNIIDYTTEVARRNPKLFIGAEALTAGAAGAAGGAAESFYPGEGGVRFASEFGASVFTPGRFLFNGLNTAFDTVKNVTTRQFSSEVVDQNRANRLYSILDGVLKESAPIRELEELGTPEALQQASFLRERYYKNLIKQLEADLPPDARPTAAQATGDPGLSILELSLARGDPAFRSKVENQALLAMRAQQSLIEALRNVGDPTSLRIAADLQAKNYDNMVLGRIKIAEGEAADAVSRIRVDSPASRRLIGDTISRNVFQALDEAREYERKLWREAYQSSMRVSKTGVVTPRQIVPKKMLVSYLDMVANMTPERYNALPNEVRSIMERLGINETAISSYRRGMKTPEYLATQRVPDEYIIGGSRWGRGKDGKRKIIFEPLGKKTDIDELIRIRGDLLAFARDAASSTAQRSPNNARMYGILSESILDDFSQLNTAAYDRARTFSRSLNDNFTRSYAKDITSVSKAGAERIPPEILVSQMSGRNSDLTFARMEQIEDAVGLFSRQYDALTQQLAQLRAAKAPPTQIGIVRQQLKELEPLADISKKRVISVTDAMESVLRLAANDPAILNPQTGRVNPRALAAWMTRNEAALNKFGSLKNDLRNALDAETAFAALNDPNSAAARQIRDQEAFSSVLVGGEKPTAAVSDVLTSRTPVTGLRKLIEVVNSAGDNRDSAMNGLKSSIFEWAYTKAGGTGNQFSAKAFDDNLFKPLAPGQPSIINLLRTQGMMTSDEVKNIRRMLRSLRRVEEAKDNRAFIENIIANGDPIDAFAVRFVALHLGSSAIPTGPGSLAAASAVSSTAQRIFNEMPRFNALAGLREAAADPKLMAALLRKGRTDQENMAFLKELQDRFSAAGILVQTAQRGTIPFLNVTEERQADVERRRREAREKFNQRPPAPATRGLPSGGLGFGGGLGAPPTPPAGGGAPPTTQSRMMLQQLFPNDAIMGAAAMQAGAPPMPG